MFSVPRWVFFLDILAWVIYDLLELSQRIIKPIKFARKRSLSLSRCEGCLMENPAVPREQHTNVLIIINILSALHCSTRHMFNKGLNVRRLHFEEYCLYAFLGGVFCDNITVYNWDFTFIYSFLLGKRFFLLRVAVDLGACSGNTAWEHFLNRLPVTLPTHSVFTPRSNLQNKKCKILY